MKFSCPHCGFDYELGVEYFGNHFNCSNCGRRVDVMPPAAPPIYDQPVAIPRREQWQQPQSQPSQNVTVIVNNSGGGGAGCLAVTVGGVGLISVGIAVLTIPSPPMSMFFLFIGITLSIFGITSNRGRAVGIVALCIALIPVLVFISLLSAGGVAALLDGDFEKRNEELRKTVERNNALREQEAAEAAASSGEYWEKE